LPVSPELRDQQVALWMQQGHVAYSRRQIARALNYFRRALEYAERRGLDLEIGRVCRDLAYVYAREGAAEQALFMLDRGLAIGSSELDVRAGLMVTKAGVLTRRGSYREALALLEECVRIMRSEYGDLAGAPRHVVRSYAGVVRMAHDLGKVVSLLDMGINPKRIEVEIKSHIPPWLAPP
jgi:tetratricopeptide (TPR) repeat protein